MGKLNIDTLISCPYPALFFMKSLIIAASSILCILSIPNIANANHHSINQILIAKQPNSVPSNAISASDLKGIEQAVVEYYKNLNRGPEYPSASGSNTFYEVTNLKITSFSIFENRGDVEGQTRILAAETQRSYSFGGNDAVDKKNKVIPKKYKYVFVPTENNTTTRNREITLIKRNGKWEAR
jgi:hypothetical protein